MKIDKSAFNSVFYSVWCSALSSAKRCLKSGANTLKKTSCTNKTLFFTREAFFYAGKPKSENIIWAGVRFPTRPSCTGLHWAIQKGPPWNCGRLDGKWAQTLMEMTPVDFFRMDAAVASLYPPQSQWLVMRTFFARSLVLLLLASVYVEYTQATWFVANTHLQSSVTYMCVQNHCKKKNPLAVQTSCLVMSRTA